MKHIRSLARALPFLAWLPELRRPRVLRADILAGTTVALVLIPQSMAYAQLAGLPPYYGLYASFLPPMIGALFGSSRQLATGPVAIVSLLTAAALEPIAASGSAGYIAYAIGLSLIVGVFQLVLGILRLGVVVNFLSHPVIIGFTNAAAIIIASSQLDKIFGVRVAKAAYHYETVWNTIIAAIDQTHWPSVAMAVGAWALMLSLKHLSPRIPNVLVAVAVTTTISWAIQFERVKQVSPGQIASVAVHEIIAEEIALRKELPNLEAAIREAERVFRETEARHGVDDSGTLSAQHLVDTLRLKRERRIRSVKADIEELKRNRFERVEGGDGQDEMYYLRGHLPQGAQSDGRLWRIRAVEDTRIVMNGGGNVVGAVPTGLPSFEFPKVDFSVVLQLLSAAIAISLLGFMEAISVAKAMATTTRNRLDANQELIGQGLANVLGSLTHSYPTSGSFSRSAVNLTAGAITGLSSVVTSLVVVATLLWLTPLVYHLPQATLAAVIMMAAMGLVDLKAVRHAWRAHPQDGLVSVVSFAITLALAPHLDKGILIGAGLALVLYLYRSMAPRVAVLARHPDGTLRDAESFGLRTCAEISMIRFDGSLYFANTTYFEDKIMERVALKPDLKFVIVVGEGINQVDATGDQVLSHLAERLRARGVEMLFTGLKQQVMDVFQRTGFYQRIGERHFFRTESAALEYVWNSLGNGHEVDCPLNIVCPVTPDK